VQKHLHRAGARNCPLPGFSTEYHHPFRSETLYMNFLSASNFWNVGCWPKKIAEKVNPAVIEYLCTKHPDGNNGDGSTGILICDWVGLNGDWDLVRCIIGMNSLLQKGGTRYPGHVS
jgi:1-phosphatidylinositol phosphodiesterase